MSDDSETAEAEPQEITCSGGVSLRLRTAEAPASSDDEGAGNGD